MGIRDINYIIGPDPGYVCEPGYECERYRKLKKEIAQLETALTERDRLIGELLTGGIGAVEVDSDYRYWLDEKWTEWDEMKEAGE